MTEEQLTRAKALDAQRTLTAKALDRIDGDPEWGIIDLGADGSINVRQIVLDALRTKINIINQDLRVL